MRQRGHVLYAGNAPGWFYRKKHQMLKVDKWLWMREWKKNFNLTKLSEYVRCVCENAHTSVVSLSHRASVYESVPTNLMNVWQNPWQGTCQDVGSRVTVQNVFRAMKASQVWKKRQVVLYMNVRSHLRIYFDCGDVCLPVHVSHHSLVSLAVVELHAQLGPPCNRGGRRRRHHVSVGHNDARVGNDETGATGKTHVASKQRMSRKESIRRRRVKQMVYGVTAKGWNWVNIRLTGEAVLSIRLHKVSRFLPNALKHKAKHFIIKLSFFSYHIKIFPIHDDGVEYHGIKMDQTCSSLSTPPPPDTHTHTLQIARCGQQQALFSPLRRRWSWTCTEGCWVEPGKRLHWQEESTDV